MPEIVRLSNCKICVYAGDHAPPHFHVRGPGWTAAICMTSFKVLKGSGPRCDLEEAIRWAITPDNSYRLAYEWRRLNERE
ncbi:DUF4160 domain-containing protein [Pseudorhodoplanes sinuspersici]|uniref:Uncharacterized protein n=1 Tax=Pseudorhodoplanes sinuspersici TaxID=1235591 RepID=A0A1W6ZUB9_9HYPH|nr:hypothetical protein CAK95_18915 [Pseudorhodoplanes sinuspersici]RKE72560.1 uncharacterized protein DUF4160 [Pseudorhodoplanes sinuspersici]